MIRHPTTNGEPTHAQSQTTAIVLIGPPASGKSTVRQLCTDYGVPGFDLHELRSPSQSQEEYHATIRDELVDDEYTGPAVCIEGAITPEEIAVVADLVDNVLRCKLEAPVGERRARYLERELETTSGEAMDETAEIEARSREQRRTRQESPYPEHDVVLDNGSDTRVGELTRRVGNILAVVGMRCERPPDETAQASGTTTQVPTATDDYADIETIVERARLDPYE